MSERAEHSLSERNADRRGAPPRHTRRLTDKVLIAFHQACDQSDFEVAEQLLQILEMIVRRRPLPFEAGGGRRRNMESLVAAHERLWLLRHPDADQEEAYLFASKGKEAAGVC